MNLPVYIQIHNDLKQKIEAGSWQVGTRIPSERKLAETYHVSRMTLRQAVQTLIDEGLLRRAIGSGTFVTNQKVQEHMSGISSFTETMEAVGKVPSSKTLSYKIIEPTFKESQALELKANERVLRMERLRFGDGEPICLETTTVSAELIKGMPQVDVTESFYRSLAEQKGIIPANAKQYISAILASPRIAEMLDIKAGDPILKLKQISYLKNQKPFEFVETQYVAQRFEFYLNK
ncbi:GntR family transcriptional regulator [Fructilactobacillus frigidiflavus]|uniref:GntR family transcriptional regulator n=1 Tax=Fructilactobacillus frigidiflavus TaxID=3242688 RepID=UPI003757EF98